MKVSATDILNASILIVDDQASNIELLEQMLLAEGYTWVSSTSSGFMVELTQVYPSASNICSSSSMLDA